MTAVLRFALIHLAGSVLLFFLASAALGSLATIAQPALIVFAAWASRGQGVRVVFAMLAALVLINLTIALGFAGPAVLPGLWSEFTAAPVLLTLWMLSALIVPGLLIAGGVWLRHITSEIRRRRT
jgi:hypothetical protein